MNTSGNYRNIWRNVSSKLSDIKAHKYSSEDILKLNHFHSYGDENVKNV